MNKPETKFIGFVDRNHDLYEAPQGCWLYDTRTGLTKLFNSEGEAYDFISHAYPGMYLD